METNLIIQTAFLGDVILTIPMVESLKKIDSSKELGFVGRKEFKELMEYASPIDFYIEIEKGDKASYEKAIEKLKEKKIKNVFCPHESLRSALFVKKINAKNKIGFRNIWNFFVFNKRYEKPNSHMVLRQLKLLNSVDNNINIETIKKEKKFLFSKKSNRNIICFAPGSVWGTKRWTPHGFINLGKEFSKRGETVKVIGSESERQLCEDIAKEIKGAESLAGKTNLIQSVDLLAQSKLLVSNDSGAGHLASLSQTPTVVIFGPTRPQFGFVPWNNKVKIAEIDLKCRPCGLHGSKVCPIGTHECMSSLNWKSVLNLADELLRL